MKVALLTWGSRGDVQPMVALANELVRRGHTVELVAPENLSGLASKLLDGASYHSLTGDTEQLVKSDLGREWIENGNFGKFMAAFKGLMTVNEEANMAEVLKATEGCDFIVVQMLMRVFGVPLAEKLNLPLLFADLLPMRATCEFPFAFVRPTPFPYRALNRLSNFIAQKVFWAKEGERINRVRGKMGVQAISHKANMAREETLGRLQGYSSFLMPPPADWKDTNIRQCGFWTLKPSSIPHPIPEGLEAWVSKGSKPVYIGWGSMVANSRRLSLLAIGALKRAGKRGVILRGWGKVGAAQLPPSEKALIEYAKENVFEVDSVPHSWIFPLCSVVVHHGGAGTTAASVGCGVPTVVTSFFADQPFWGYRTVAAGVAPITMNIKTATASRLGDAVTEACKPIMQARAVELGAQLSAQDGTARAVDHIEDAAKSWDKNTWSEFHVRDKAQSGGWGVSRILALAFVLIAVISVCGWDGVLA